jgi:hypothetical protein
MKGKDFLDKMEFINDELIETAFRVRKSEKAKTFRRKWAIAAACLCALFIGCATVNAATNGMIVKKIKQWFTGEILTNNIVVHQEDIYAKQILFCNEKIIVFGDELGAVVYNYKQDIVLGAINLQEIQCNFINTQIIKTQFLSENREKLWIYNEKNSKAHGKAYEFNLSKLKTLRTNDIPLISPVNRLDLSVKENISKLEDIKNVHYSKYVDVFSNIPLIHEKLKDKYCSYSELAYVFKNEYDQEIACLMFTSTAEKQNQTTEICFYNLKTGKYEMKPLKIQANKSEFKQLPVFKCTGSDKIVKAVCDYLYSRETKYPDALFIPYPVILKVIEKDNKVKIYGNFYSGHYKLYGNQLNEKSGGESPAVITFQREVNGNLSFIEINTAGDGSYYSKDIKKFCKGISGLYNKFMNHEALSKERNEIRIQMISEYEKTNHLGIKYIKDYGWDPIKINK